MRRSWTILIVSLGLLVAACGSSGNSNSSSSSTTGSSRAAATKITVGRFTFPGGKASGTPIKIGDVETNQDTPEYAPAENAAVKYINAQLGGINGHPLQIVHCNEQLSPSVSAQCTQQFIQDGVVGVVGFPLVWDSVQISAIEQAHLPDLTAFASGLPAYNCTVCHTLGGGYPSSNGSEVPWLKEQGVKSVAIITVNVPGGLNAGNFLAGLLHKAGIKVTTKLSHANAAPDVTTGVRKAVATHPDDIIFIDGAQDCGREVVAAAQAGFKGKLLLTPTCATAGVVHSMGSAAKQTVYTAYTLSYADTSNPEVAAYRKAMAQYSGGTLDFTSLGGFANIMTVAAALEHMKGTITSAAVNNYFNTTPVIPVYAGYALVSRDVPPEAAYHSYRDSFDRVFLWNGSTFLDQGKWYSGWFTADPSIGASS
jgi:branched-chain amino acid transport system substrate-binding protein